MKKYFLFLSLSIFLTTSLANAIKFDPSEATVEDFKLKISGLRQKIIDIEKKIQEEVQISSEALPKKDESSSSGKRLVHEKDLLTQQGEALFSIAKIKFMSKHQQVEHLEVLEKAYEVYKRAKIQRLFLKYKGDISNEDFSFNPDSLKGLKLLLRTQYRGEDKTKSYDAKLDEMLKRKNVMVDPVFYLKILETWAASDIARLKDRLLSIPERKVKKAIEYAEKKLVERQQTFDYLRGAFEGMVRWETSNHSYYNYSAPEGTVVNFCLDLPQLATPAKPAYMSATSDGFIVKQGLEITDKENGKVLKTQELVMKGMTEEDVARWKVGGFFGNQFIVKTGEGTENYAFMSDPIPVLNFLTFMVSIKAQIEVGGFGIGFLSENKEKRLAYKSVQTEFIFNVIDAQLRLPEITAEKVILFITNNQQQAARSRLILNELKIKAQE